MDEKTRSIRIMLSNMAPAKAVGFIKAFELPEEEENCLIDGIGVRGESDVAISQKYGMSPETVRRKRRAALIRISNSI